MALTVACVSNHDLGFGTPLVLAWQKALGFRWGGGGGGGGS